MSRKKKMRNRKDDKKADVLKSDDVVAERSEEIVADEAVTPTTEDIPQPATPPKEARQPRPKRESTSPNRKPKVINLFTVNCCTFAYKK